MYQHIQVSKDTTLPRYALFLSNFGLVASGSGVKPARKTEIQIVSLNITS